MKYCIYYYFIKINFWGGIVDAHLHLELHCTESVDEMMNQ